MRTRRRPGRTAVVLAAALGSSGCRKLPGPTLQEPEQRLEGLTLEQSFRGSRSWDLKADHAHLKEADKLALLEEPRMAFYKENRVVTRLASRVGYVRMDTSDVRLSSDVVVNSLEDQSTLTTSELNYSSSRRKFLTDKDVVVVRPRGTLRGRGLEAEPDLSEIKVFHQRAEVQGDR